jgi:DNA-binding NarL/FixJ family response regulator
VPTTETIRLLLSSRNSIARYGVRMLLSHDSSIQIVGEVKSARLILSESMRLNPDFVLMDMDMSRPIALNLIRRMRQARKRMGILLFSTWNEPDHIDQCLLAGANDYVSGAASSTELLRMLHARSASRETIHPASAGEAETRNRAAIPTSRGDPFQIEMRKKR